MFVVWIDGRDSIALLHTFSMVNGNGYRSSRLHQLSGYGDVDPRAYIIARDKAI